MALDPESFVILLSSIQKYIRERLVPMEDRVEQDNEVPQEIVQEMKDMGFFGLSIPQAYGGIGLSMLQEARVVYEFGQTAFAFRSVFGTNVGIGSQGILMDGTAEQKALYLPQIASGELQMSFALTEPDSGSDAASIKTQGVREGDDYLLTGTKQCPHGGRFYTDGSHRWAGCERHLSLYRPGPS